jgi:membrane protease YdiL (CAAX protease family)
LAALQPALPFLLALLAVLWLDRATRRRGLDPPGFASPARRAGGLAALGSALALSSFAPLAALGSAAVEPDFTTVPAWQLFALHAVLLLALGGWYVAGYAGSGARFADQVGLRASRPLVEVGVGTAFGIAAWLVVLVSAYLVALALAAWGGEELLPKSPPAAVAWLAGQSVVLRAALALSAGIVEEIFFRGLLQPRVGIVVSTALFTLAHLSYGQLFMLLGVTILSFLYAWLVEWRQSLWAAMAAHAVFDLVQLLVVVPAVLREFGGFLP